MNDPKAAKAIRDAIGAVRAGDYRGLIAALDVAGDSFYVRGLVAERETWADAIAVGGPSKVRTETLAAIDDRILDFYGEEARS